MFRKLTLAICVLFVLVTACETFAPFPSSTEDGNRVARARTVTPAPTSDEEALSQLINAECEAVVEQDVDRLENLWASYGVVTDANSTPDNPGDDATWRGWDALRDRYINIIFVSTPTFCKHPDIQITIHGNDAAASSGATIGVTNCKDCRMWTFAKGGDGWKITLLIYNLTPQ